MYKPIITENSAGNPIHNYIPSQDAMLGGGPLMKMISETHVVPVGLVIINPIHDTHSESIFQSPSISNGEEEQLVEYEEIPDHLFNQCVHAVSDRNTRPAQTKKMPPLKRIRTTIRK